MARTRLYRHAVLVHEDFPPEDVSEHVADPDAVVWLDYCQPSEQTLATIEEELSLHTWPSRTLVDGHFDVCKRSPARFLTSTIAR